MAPELFRISRIEDWPPVSSGGKTLWVITGETSEEPPRALRLKTTDAWKASLLQQLQKANQLAWVTWMAASRGDAWLQRCEPDETRFRYADGAHV